MTELIEIADHLYALPVTSFTAARDEAARGCDDKALAAQVKKLRKPSVAAAAINLLVRRESERIDEVLSLAAALREAAEAMDGDELRALTRQRRQLTHALASSARALARTEGTPLTSATTDQVEQMLNAAMLDPVAADVLRTGLVVVAFTATGVGSLDPAAVLAVPSSVGTRAVPVAAPAPDLHAVPDTDEIRRARLEEAVASVASTLSAAEADLAAAEQAASDSDAERLRIADELDAARRRVADLEEEADRIETDAADAADARDEAAAAVADARSALNVAQRALDAGV
ncbi:MAG TPA: hypothetical protein VF426_12165 [Marmoricola sp.]